MACFSAAWFEQFLIWLAILVFIVAVVKLVVPWLLSLFGTPPDGGMILKLLGYLVWLIVVIAVIIFLFRLIACFGGLPRF